MKLKIQILPTLTLRVTPQLITTQQLLLLNNLELSQSIEEEMEQNPALELDEETINICPECASNCQSFFCSNCGWKKIEKKDISLEEVSYLEDIVQEDRPPRDKNFSLNSPTFPARECLSDYILFNLYPLEKKEKEIAQVLADNISEDGYLEIDLDEVANRTNATGEEVNIVLKKIQCLEPAGMGARNLQETLLIQIDNLSIEENNPHSYLQACKPASQQASKGRVREVVEKYLDDLKKHNYVGISKGMNISTSEVREIVEFIKHHLTPHPARGITFSPAIENVYLRPEVIIHKDQDTYRVEIVERQGPNLRISHNYLEMYRKMKSKVIDYSEEEFNHLKNYLERAKFYLQCLQSRYGTMKKITEAIVNYQKDFLDCRDKEYLMPLTQSKISEITGLSESTVSRAVSNKCVQLPWFEVVPFQIFFEQSTSIKEQILKIIENEEGSKPLSDMQIAEILANKGINIARRTIAKYREELNVLPSPQRKKI